MRLYLNNIGKLKEADIKLEGITVVAGENNSGKSTVGKALYAACNSFLRAEDEKSSLKNEYVNKLISKFRGEINLDILENYDYSECNVVENFEAYAQEVFIALQEKNQNFHEQHLRNAANDYISMLTITEEELNIHYLTKWFNYEFKGEISNFHQSNLGMVKIDTDFGSFYSEFVNNEFQMCSGNIKFTENIILLDDPNVLNELSYSLSYHGFQHSRHIASLLRITQDENSVAESIFIQRKLRKVFTLLNSVCENDLSVKGGSTYQIGNTGKSLSASNLSTGLKTFVCLKTLLLNGSIREGSILILDEPEIHLHPEWQLVYAELIVLLQKEFKLTILLTTHSPYFLRALEVYAEVHKVSDKCNYYFAKNEGQEAMIYDVTEDIEQVYKKLADPFQMLENLRWQDEP